jgi:hypothetical protein
MNVEAFAKEFGERNRIRVRKRGLLSGMVGTQEGEWIIIFLFSDEIPAAWPNLFLSAAK